MPLIDGETGAIDKEVAEYWRENFDLSHILRRDYSKLRQDLEGKIHIYCGDMDNFYLNNAVYLIEDVLKEVCSQISAPPVWHGCPFEPACASAATRDGSNRPIAAALSTAEVEQDRICFGRSTLTASGSQVAAPGSYEVRGARSAFGEICRQYNLSNHVGSLGVGTNIIAADSRTPIVSIAIRH